MNTTNGNIEEIDNNKVIRKFRVVYRNQSHTGNIMKLVRETKCYWFLYVDDSSFVFKYHKNTFKTKVIKVKNIDLVNGKYDIDYSFEGVEPILIKEI